MFKRSLATTLVALSLATIVAFLWSYFVRHMYHYNIRFPIILGVNAFPLICWTLALTAGYLSISYVLRRLHITNFALQLVSVIMYYAVWVIVVETVGYHVFGVKDTSTAQYPGLPLCDCLHAPGWMQFAYFALGPAHWVVTQALPWTRQK